MGTDIYLSWDKMTKKESDKQITGFDITKGSTGYLRASIGMREENNILRQIFPDEYWDSGGDSLPYDFEDNYYLMLSFAKDYIKQNFKDDTDVDNFLALESLSVEEPKTEKEWKKVWFTSLIYFFRLGMIKQREGKKPKLLISY